ncbi:hypothetical protein FM21_35060 [Streptomyces mutabilis]|uniref:Uncharacterized protein n=1 Tax=Streptomyces mutabilis TaxID=67332 RepID=A0A086MRG0_9ACTN|nr:hypothetical protein FM21_35060 [Streptomyces mutabilis]
MGDPAMRRGTARRVSVHPAQRSRQGRPSKAFGIFSAELFKAGTVAETSHTGTYALTAELVRTERLLVLQRFESGQHSAAPAVCVSAG